MAFLLIVAFASLLASPPSLSASAAPHGGFKAALKHVDHAKGLTPNEHFKRAVQRSNMRVESQKPPHSANAFSGARIESGTGEFLMNLTIGTPPTTYLAVIDTDTDFIWTACKPMLCGKECSKLQPYNPLQSSTYSKLSCTSTPCRLATNTSCNAKSCSYKYQYTSGIPIWTQGDLATEAFRSFVDGKASSLVGNLIFGCVHTASINFGELGSGFVSLGRGIMSLVSQIKVDAFSHCFPSYDDPKKSGTLAFGGPAKIAPQKNTVTTDMLHNPKRSSSYYVNLKGIKVNGVSLADIDASTFEVNTDGEGGLVIDSGMTVSYLEGSAYYALKEKLASLIKLERFESELDELGLDLCYKVPKEMNAADFEKSLPKIAFTFGNGNGQADLELPNENVFRSYEDGQYGEVSCLAMTAAPGSDGRSSLGNVQLQDTLVAYDLAAKKVSFTPNTQCETM